MSGKKSSPGFPSRPEPCDICGSAGSTATYKVTPTRQFPKTVLRLCDECHADRLANGLVIGPWPPLIGSPKPQTYRHCDIAVRVWPVGAVDEEGHPPRRRYVPL
jgi:hypothetical protein